MFKESYESATSQISSGITVRHIVSFDTEQAQEYIKSYSIYKTVNLISSKLHPNKYIDEMYKVIDLQEDAWIIVLDDDDKFTTPYALRALRALKASNVSKDMNPANLYIWMLHRPDKYIYPSDKEHPKMGEIGTCCYAYHASKIKYGYWGADGIGDYTFFEMLFKRLNPIYIDVPLVTVNYKKQISGWTAM